MFSRRNQFSSFPSDLDWRRGKDPRSRLRRQHTVLRTEPLFLIPLGAKISGSVMASDRVHREQSALLSAEPLVLIRFNSHRPLDAPIFLPERFRYVLTAWR
jgi:hypothetical protein